MLGRKVTIYFERDRFFYMVFLLQDLCHHLNEGLAILKFEMNCLVECTDQRVQSKNHFADVSLGSEVIFLPFISHVINIDLKSLLLIKDVLYRKIGNKLRIQSISNDFGPTDVLFAPILNLLQNKEAICLGPVVGIWKVLNFKA